MTFWMMHWRLDIIRGLHPADWSNLPLLSRISRDPDPSTAWPLEAFWRGVIRPLSHCRPWPTCPVTIIRLMKSIGIRKLVCITNDSPIDIHLSAIALCLLELLNTHIVPWWVFWTPLPTLASTMPNAIAHQPATWKMPWACTRPSSESAHTMVLEWCELVEVVAAKLMKMRVVTTMLKTLSRISITATTPPRLWWESRTTGITVHRNIGSPNEKRPTGLALRWSKADSTADTRLDTRLGKF